MKIVIRRTGALGDVLCVTPVLRALRKHYPDDQIVVETGYPDVFKDNPCLVAEPPYDWSRLRHRIDLDLAYERRPNMHVVDAYLTAASSPESSHALRSVQDVDRTLSFARGPVSRIHGMVVIHAARSWPSRTFSPWFWDSVARKIKDSGCYPVFVGSRRDYGGPPIATNMLGLHNLAQVAALIAGADLMIGSDSALLHLAGTTETPIIGLYTAVRAKYRMPWRHGVLGWNMVGLEADVPCMGCLERAPIPSTNLICQYDTNACVRTIAPERVLEAVNELLGKSAINCV